MKVNEIINIADKIVKICKLYEELDIDEMLDNIYNDLLYTKTSKKSAKEIKNEKDEDLAIFIEKLNSLNKDDIYNVLKNYKVIELKKIASIIGLKIKGSLKKNEIINVIVEHFNYKLLNQKISERERFIH